MHSCLDENSSRTLTCCWSTANRQRLLFKAVWRFKPVIHSCWDSNIMIHSRLVFILLLSALSTLFQNRPMIYGFYLATITDSLINWHNILIRWIPTALTGQLFCVPVEQLDQLGSDLRADCILCYILQKIVLSLSNCLFEPATESLLDSFPRHID